MLHCRRVSWLNTESGVFILVLSFTINVTKAILGNISKFLLSYVSRKIKPLCVYCYSVAAKIRNICSVLNIQ